MVINSFTGNYAFLSNFAPCKVKLTDDVYTYHSVEHAYQAAKTLDIFQRYPFSNPALYPGAAKKMGRALEIRPDWKAVKLTIMEHLVWQKFDLPHFMEKLLLTGDAELVEGNWWGDTFWGVCNGVGQNHLGKILMCKRDQLRMEIFYDDDL